MYVPSVSCSELARGTLPYIMVSDYISSQYDTVHFFKLKMFHSCSCLAWVITQSRYPPFTYIFMK